MLIPILRLPTVFHVGTMIHPPPGPRNSYEGNALSVSLCPEAWTSIARLGGRPIRQLVKPGGSFVHARALSRKAKNQIRTWARETGILGKATIWRLPMFDEEGESDGYMEFLDESEAQAEFNSYYGDSEEFEEQSEAPRLTKKPDDVATQKLLDIVNVDGPVLGRSAFDFALMAWVYNTDLDGVWWSENYDPISLSAPRGAISPGKIKQWAVKTIRKEISDEWGLNLMPTRIFTDISIL